MNPFDFLADIFRGMGNWCRNAGDGLLGKPFIPGILPDFFYAFAIANYDTATWLYHLAISWDKVWEAVGNFLTKLDVLDIMSQFIKQLGQVWSWFSNWWGNVWDTIDDWWDGVYGYVKDWVSTAIQGVRDWVDDTRAWLGRLESDWVDFRQNILSTLARTFDVQQMINGALLPWRDLFNFWGSFSHEVGAFFTNPIEYIWNRFSDWFFGG